MKNLSVFLLLSFSILFVNAQNHNLSGTNYFDGEPFLTVNPSNNNHIVVAWMGYIPLNRIAIKTKVSMDGGYSWSSENFIQHTNSEFGSADPSLAFDNSGNVYLSYIDYSTLIDSGYVYVVKSTDGGYNWQSPVPVIDAHADPGKYPLDRPWMSVDISGGSYDGNIYITTMPPKVFGYLPPPYHPYLMYSNDGGASFSNWEYLDTANWLAGSLIPQPMPTNCVSASGVFHAIYPSYVSSQNVFPQYIIASSADGGNSFTYNSVFSVVNNANDSLSKSGYLLRSDPSDYNHLAFFYLGGEYGDLDVFIRESYDQGQTWSSATRINDDPIANNRMQDLVWADYNQNGDLVVSWRDRRNASDSTYMTKSEIWGAVKFSDSTDFTQNFRISDTIAAYDTILAEAGNDFMCINLVGDTINAVWGDVRNGVLTIWFSKISVNGTVLKSEQISAEDIPDIKIFPNPVKEYLTIKSAKIVNIEIYNNSAKLMRHYNDLNTDKFSLDFQEFSTGIYYVKIETDKGVVFEKVVKE